MCAGKQEVPGRCKESGKIRLKAGHLNKRKQTEVQHEPYSDAHVQMKVRSVNNDKRR